MPDVDVYLARANTLFDKCALEPEYRQAMLDRYFKWAGDPVVTATVSFITEHATQLKDYHAMLNTMLPAEVVTWIIAHAHPMVILTPNKIDHLRVFPNIVFDPGEFNIVENLKITNATTALGAFVQMYQDDMSGRIPSADEKWKTPERISKRLADFIDVPTARAFTRYYRLEENFKADKVRDLADRFDVARKPMALLYADQPKDFLIMYGSGPSSCMVHSSYKDTWKPLDNAGLTPTSFYAYFPWTRGAYIMKHGKVVARTILFASSAPTPSEMGYPNFNKGTAKGWRFGRVYSVNPEMDNELRKALKSAGYGPLSAPSGSGKFIPPLGVEFRIPGVKLSTGQSIMPFPYFDNMDYHGRGFYATFDDKTNEFVIQYQEATKPGAVPITGRGGFLKSSDYIKKVCDYCGGVNSGGWQATDAGTIYCSPEHAKKAGFMRVVTGVGSVWRKVENLEDFIQAADGTLFNTLRAAADNGYILPMLEAGVFAEEQGADLVNRGTFLHRDMLGQQFYSQLSGAVAGFTNAVFPMGHNVAQKVVAFDMEDEPLVVAA